LFFYNSLQEEIEAKDLSDHVIEQFQKAVSQIQHDLRVARNNVKLWVFNKEQAKEKGTQIKIIYYDDQYRKDERVKWGSIMKLIGLDGLVNEPKIK